MQLTLRKVGKSGCENYKSRRWVETATALCTAPAVWWPWRMQKQAAARIRCSRDI